MAVQSLVSCYLCLICGLVVDWNVMSLLLRYSTGWRPIFESQRTLRISFPLQSRYRHWETLHHHSKPSLNRFSVKNCVERTSDYSPPSYTDISNSSINICIIVLAILPVLLCGCETCLLTVREESRLRIGCRWEYLDLKGMRWHGSGGNEIMKRLMIFTPHPVLCGW